MRVSGRPISLKHLNSSHHWSPRKDARRRDLGHACAMSSPASVVWFRKGLRIHDNPALLEAAASITLCPVFCLDPWFIASGNVGANRLNFLLQSLNNLHKNLQKRNSRLIVLHGDPKVAIPAVVSALGAHSLCFEKDTEPYAISRDAAVSAAVKELGCDVKSCVSHTLWDVEYLIAKNQGKAPETMSSFTALVKRIQAPAKPLEAPEKLPAAPQDLSGISQWLWNGTGDVPTAADLQIELPNNGAGAPFQGGEDEALARLGKYMARGAWVRSFEKPKGNPASFDPEPATTVLSPYLKFGCLSPRKFYWDLKDVYGKGKHTEPPVSLLGQLYWREFFYTVGYDTPNHHQMEGNASVRQIPWSDQPELVKAWEEGRTGFPWIDAVMRQLHAWGWMHHLARHSVACFLTRGDLWCHWEKGRDVFDKYLLDADHYINNGNWQWLSCSRFFYQYFRVYSPISFGQKYDKNGDFIRHFVPELKDFPAKYIYEPWTAPLETQRKAACIIGVDYPHPIVDHKEAMTANKGRMQQAYAAGKAGSTTPAGGANGGVTGKAAHKSLLTEAVQHSRKPSGSPAKKRKAGTL